MLLFQSYVVWFLGCISESSGNDVQKLYGGKGHISHSFILKPSSLKYLPQYLHKAPGDHMSASQPLRRIRSHSASSLFKTSRGISDNFSRSTSLNHITSLQLTVSEGFEPSINGLKARRYTSKLRDHVILIQCNILILFLNI